MIDYPYIPGSRIHELHSYVLPSPGRSLYIKRDDELGAGIFGSKYRKFASLLPFLREGNYDEVVAIGGSNSANILGLLQLCKENQIPLKLFLLKSHTQNPKGNELWIGLLMNENQAFEIDRKDWPNVNQLAEEYARKQSNAGKKIFIIPEGCAVKEAIPGAMTLAKEIIEYEKDNSVFFDHLFIDSGTGTTAVGLVLGLSFSKSGPRNIHITLIAGSEAEFKGQLDRFSKETGINIWPDLELHFYKPAIARSFGSVNSQVLEETIKIANSEGTLMDPVYSVKHLFTARQVIEKNNLIGNILFIYSGSAFGLAGFQQELANILYARKKNNELAH